MTNAGSKKKGEGSTLKYQKSKTAERKRVSSPLLSRQGDKQQQTEGPQQASDPKIKVPEGSITEYTYMQYRLGTRPIPGNLNARTCRPSHATDINAWMRKAVMELPKKWQMSCPTSVRLFPHRYHAPRHLNIIIFIFITLRTQIN